METLQTRIPVFLWDALQDTLFQHDHQFLRDISSVIGVPATDMKRTIFGSRGQKTTIAVLGGQDQWWEGQLCPYNVRSSQGVWKPCGELREAHGACIVHKNSEKIKDSNVLHKDSPYLARLPKRKPMKWKDDIIWVAPDTKVFHEDGTLIEGLLICPKSGIVLAHN